MRVIYLPLLMLSGTTAAQPLPPVITAIDGVPVSSRPACDVTITSNTDWSAANNGAVRVVCVNPGVANAGVVTLTASGTGSLPRWLRLAGDDDTHPALLATNQTAAVAVLNITGSNWIIDRMSIRNAHGISNWSGTNNVFQFGVFDTRIGTGNGLKLSLSGSNHTILNSVFRNPLRTPGVDSYAVYISGGSGMRIIGNEFIDQPNGTQIPPGTGGGHIVSDNEFYQTSANFANCTTGALTPTGECMCGEGFAFVAKGTGVAQSFIERNLVWDYSQSASNCSGSGGGGGTMMNLGSGNQQTNNYTIRDNTLIGRIAGANRPTYGIYTGLNGAFNTISENFIANTNHPFDALYFDNSTYANNIYSNNLTGFNTSAQAVGNTVIPTGTAGRAAVAGERCAVKFHLTNPTPVCYP